MIAIGLLIVIAAYVGLFVFAGIKNRTWNGRVKYWVLLLAPLVLLTWDMPVGYYQFRQACAMEGGLQAYQVAERATHIRLAPGYFDKDHAEGLLRRFPQLVTVDARDSSGPLGRDFEYIRAPDGKAIISKPFDDHRANASSSNANARSSYELDHVHDEFPYRRFKDRFELKRADGTLVARWTTIGFRWTNEARTLFGRTQVSYCYNESLPYDHLVRLFAE